jgi:aldose 1-epimerase
MERLEFGNRHLRAEALPELGGRLSRLRYLAEDGPRDVLVPIGAEPALPPSWPKGGAYPLVPYSNRIVDARLLHAGKTHSLVAHPDAKPHALHGHTQLRPWRIAARSDVGVALAIEHAGDAHWPWAFSASQRFWIEDATLNVAIELRNDAASDAPAGIGWHPYFAISGDPAIALDARTEWLQDDANVPTGETIAAPQGGLALDRAGGTRYLGGWNGGASFDTGLGLGLALRADPIFGQMVVHRPRNIDYLCLEPVSHVANGFNLAAKGWRETGTVVLKPGESVAGRLALTVESKQPLRAAESEPALHRKKRPA